MSIVAITLVHCGGDNPRFAETEEDAAQDAAPTEVEAVIFDVTDVPSEAEVPETTVDIAPEVACTPGAGGLGCDCTTASDCASGVCIEGLDGRICTSRCVESCPDGFDCLPFDSGSDGVQICVPRHVTRCRPCNDDLACRAQFDSSSLCVPLADGRVDEGTFCAPTCGPAAPCPTGTTCKDVARGDAGRVNVCLPDSGACACRPSWNGRGYATTCAITNDVGRCEGTRACGPDGVLSPCPATPASVERCDAIDDDCDGSTDDADGACDDDLACTHDTCTEGVCNNLLAPGACLIEGVCYEANAVHVPGTCERCVPDVEPRDWTTGGSEASCFIDGACYPDGAHETGNVCHVCDPSDSRETWTTLSTSATCDDDDPCTKNDRCAVDGQCRGTPYPCLDDGKPCTVETCVGDGTCESTLEPGHCLIAEVCYAAAEHDSTACRYCDPVRPNTWTAASGTSCDDDDPCTTNDTCFSGACSGATLDCDDDLVCTTDACVDDACRHDIAPSTCLIAGVCHAAGTLAPDNVCQQCVGGDAWSDVAARTPCAGGLCDGNGACVVCVDNSDCASGHCVAGACVERAITFKPMRIYTGLGWGSDALTMADLDDDGDLDVVVAINADGPSTPGSRVRVLLNEGGTLTSITPYDALTRPWNVAVGDMTGDGIVDIVVVGAGGIAVLPGVGDGTFTAARVTIGTASGQEIYTSVALGEVDDQPGLDALVGIYAVERIVFFPGRGDGSFAAHRTLTAPSSGGVALVDVDADRLLDALVVDAWAGVTGLQVFVGTGAGQFGPRSSAPLVAKLYGVLSADFNGDGKPDVASASFEGGGVYVFLGDGVGGFTSRFVVTGEGAEYPAIGDIDGDGRVDIVSVANASARLKVLRGSRDGSFRVAASPSIQSQSARSAVGDLDGDGRPDVVVTSSDTLAVLINTTGCDVPGTTPCR